VILFDSVMSPVLGVRFRLHQNTSNRASTGSIQRQGSARFRPAVK